MIANRMRGRLTVRATLAVTFAVLASLSVRAQDKPKLAALFVDVDGGGAYAVGVWRPDNPSKKQLVEAVTQLSCFRRGGVDFVGTEAFCLRAMATAPNEMLNVTTEYLKVVEWNANQIIATDDSNICVTSQTIFDFKRKTISGLDVRKPEARGPSNACALVPDKQAYYLQDVSDYYAKKRAGSAGK